MLPSIKNLTYLLALREYLHFAQAANACFVSQSTLSAGIAKLESDLAVQLVDRNNKKVLLTPIGQQVANEAEQILGLMKNLVKTAQSDFFHSSLSIGVIPTIAPYLLPKFLQLVAMTYPQLKIKLIEDTSDNLLSKVAKMAIDFAFFAFPYELPNSVADYVIFKDDLLLVRHKDWQRSELYDQQLLLLEEGHCLREHILANSVIKTMPISDFSCSSLTTLVGMLNIKMGVSFLPKISLNDGVLKNYPNLVVDKSIKTSRDIGIVFKKDHIWQVQFLQLCGLIGGNTSTNNTRI